MGRLVDSADLRVETHRCFGGGPSLLAEAAELERAKSLLLAGERSGEVAEALGYRRRGSFSDAFLKRTGMRPSEFQGLHGVKPRRRSGVRRIVRRAIADRTDQKPFPRFDAKKKRKRRRKRKKKRSKSDRSAR